MASQNQSHIDIFMHSMFRNKMYPDYNKSYTFGQYRDEAYSTADSSTNRVILTNGIDTDFLNRYPDSEVFRTAVNERGHSLANVVPEDKKRFKKFILSTMNRQLYYHGAYAGLCVTGSILDIMLIRYAQDEIVDLNPAMQAHIERQAQKYHESGGNYKNSNIRLGVVLSHPKVGTHIAYPHPEDRMLQYGNDIFQLMDDSTSLHGKTHIMNTESHHYHEFEWHGSTSNNDNPPLLHEIPESLIPYLLMVYNMRRKKRTFEKYLITIQ